MPVAKTWCVILVFWLYLILKMNKVQKTVIFNKEPNRTKRNEKQIIGVGSTVNL